MHAKNLVDLSIPLQRRIAIPFRQITSEASVDTAARGIGKCDAAISVSHQRGREYWQKRGTSLAAKEPIACVQSQRTTSPRNAPDDVMLASLSQRIQPPYAKSSKGCHKNKPRPPPAGENGQRLVHRHSPFPIIQTFRQCVFRAVFKCALKPTLRWGP